MNRSSGERIPPYAPRCREDYPDAVSAQAGAQDNPTVTVRPDPKLRDFDFGIGNAYAPPKPTLRLRPSYRQ